MSIPKEDGEERYTAGDTLNPGRPIGEVLAWLWHEDRTTLVITVAELLAEAHRHQPKDQHPFRFDDLAHGVCRRRGRGP